MKVSYIGNFEPAHSTENHVLAALQVNRHDVTSWQENQPSTWADPNRVADADMVLWTRTGWDWRNCGWSAAEAFARQHALLETCATRSVPTVAYHLDRWWGLKRQPEVQTEPCFRCALVVTADGGHEKEWQAAGVNHYWLPPGVSEFECAPAQPNDRFTSELAFVGSWQPGYHPEWHHRPQLVRWLARYGNRVRFWPEPGQHAIRGTDLRELYASTKVNVGDSCLAGGATHYWSDRIPETLGRGGFLLHPHVDGMDEHFVDGTHLVTWPLGDFEELGWLVDYYLRHDDERATIACAGRAHVLAHHTYTVRMQQVEKLVAGL
jgi:hypothetical protein